MHSLHSFILVSIVSLIHGLTPDALSSPGTSRRRLFQQLRFAVAAPLLSVIAPPPSCLALDFDSFINKELESDANESKLTDDAALCRFGQPSKGTGDACIRAGLSTKRAAGGVDAFGYVDRGNFERCEIDYQVINGKYEKVTTCGEKQ